MKLLLIGDETKNRRLRSFGLAGTEDELACVTHSTELLRLAGLKDYHAAVLDWEMSGESGSAMLTALRQLAPCLPVVVAATGPGRVAAAKRAGAAVTVGKPINVAALRQLLDCLGRSPIAAPVSVAAGADEFPTQSPLMRRTLEVAWRVAPNPATVLLLGENGTGKSALARAIHARSSRATQPFVTVSCPCLQPQLLESDLFGHVRGAFTDAVQDSPGKIAAAKGGTLFLDEIGELPLEIQPKLLRLLQERCYERVGDVRTHEADIRIIAATNRDLKQLVTEGRFREDLYYRLNVISLELPPLRCRPEDIVPAAEQFLAAVGSLGHRHRGFTQLAQERLSAHAWPGNLRELRNAVERAALLCDREYLDLVDFPDLTEAPTEDPAPHIGALVPLSVIEQAHIREVIARTGSYERAAQILGIDKSTLYRRRRREGIITEFPDLTACAG